MFWENSGKKHLISSLDRDSLENYESRFFYSNNVFDEIEWLRMEKVGLFKFVKSPLGKNIYKAEVCTSSMDLAWKLHEAMALPEWSSVVVDRQINGRGRFGRAWVSPPGNLYASLLT